MNHQLPIIRIYAFDNCEFYRCTVALWMIYFNFPAVCLRCCSNWSFFINSLFNVASCCRSFMNFRPVWWKFHRCCSIRKLFMLCSCFRMACGSWNIIRYFSCICFLISMNRTRRLQIQFGCNFRAHCSQKMWRKHSDKKLFGFSGDGSANNIKRRKHKLQRNIGIFDGLLWWKNDDKFHLIHEMIALKCNDTIKHNQQMYWNYISDELSSETSSTMGWQLKSGRD